MTKMSVNRVRAMATRAGIGLRAAHHQDVVDTLPSVGWFEIHAENYLGGGPALHHLTNVRRNYPVAIHSVGLSLGSADGIDARHLGRLSDLIDRIDPCLVSEHLSWSVVRDTFLNGLLPLPYTEEALVATAGSIDRVQERIGRPILIENPSTYLRFKHSTIDEVEFLAELSRRTGCGLLCDVNNLYVNGLNHGSNPWAMLEAFPARAVAELHLAGHSINETDGGAVCIDDHGSPVCEAVWDLYARAVELFPTAVTLIEWDTNVPPLARLVEEACAANDVRNGIVGVRHVLAA
ncbi:MAG: DUF692 domain-containing protein [Alphaproteobacteria bacterium]